MRSRRQSTHSPFGKLAGNAPPPVPVPVPMPVDGGGRGRSRSARRYQRSGGARSRSRADGRTDGRAVGADGEVCDAVAVAASGPDGRTEPLAAGPRRLSGAVTGGWEGGRKARGM